MGIECQSNRLYTNQARQRHYSVHSPDRWNPQQRLVFRVRPVCIENKFQLVQPKGFNYYSADKDNLYTTCLPVALKPLLPENLDLIDTESIKVVDGAVSHPVGVAHFIKTPLEGEVWFHAEDKPRKAGRGAESYPDIQSALTSMCSSLPRTIV